MRVLKVKIISAHPKKWYLPYLNKMFYVSPVSFKGDGFHELIHHEFGGLKCIHDEFGGLKCIHEYDYEVLYECDVALMPVESNIIKPKVKKYKVLYKVGRDDYGVTDNYYSSVENFNNNNSDDFIAISLISESMKEF